MMFFLSCKAFLVRIRIEDEGSSDRKFKANSFLYFSMITGRQPGDQAAPAPLLEKRAKDNLTLRHPYLTARWQPRK